MAVDCETQYRQCTLECERNRLRCKETIKDFVQQEIADSAILTKGDIKDLSNEIRDMKEYLDKIVAGWVVSLLILIVVAVIV